MFVSVIAKLFCLFACMLFLVGLCVCFLVVYLFILFITFVSSLLCFCICLFSCWLFVLMSISFCLSVFFACLFIFRRPLTHRDGCLVEIFCTTYTLTLYFFVEITTSEAWCACNLHVSSHRRGPRTSNTLCWIWQTVCCSFATYTKLWRIT